MSETKPEWPYRTVSLPRPLIDEVEEFVEQSRRYKTIAEFVKEAIRLHLPKVTRH